MALTIAFYTHSYGLILLNVPVKTNYKFSNKTTLSNFIVCVDVWNVKSSVSTTINSSYFKPKNVLCFNVL